MTDLSFLNDFNEDECYATIGEVEEIVIADNQINYNSANSMICATSG